MLEVSALTKRYASTLVVDDVRFSVGRGEIVGFLGPNGAGKSTTLRMITGFLAPTGGNVRIDGLDALTQGRQARRRFGYMPEGVPLYPEMRVLEYLRYRADLKGVRGSKAAAEMALVQAGVKDAAPRIIGQLSKGYRQRVGLADALLGDPPLLILDEPTSGLDPNQIRHVRELIRSFAGKKTVFLSTHILPEVEATCERVVIINKGRVVGEGTPNTLRGSGRPTVRIRGRGEVLNYRRALEKSGADIVRDRDDGGIAELRVACDGGAEAVFSIIAEAGLTLIELSPEQASLEQVFASLTMAETMDDQESQKGTPHGVSEASP